MHDKRFGDGEFLRIAVFLSVLDVHVNRAPVAGRVVDYFVEDGGYANAMKPRARSTTSPPTRCWSTDHGTVAVAQRTGLIARRIVQRAPVGSLLAKGERFGLIRFGSRTDVYLPADKAEAAVAVGDKVIGGASVIARWKKPSTGKYPKQMETPEMDNSRSIGKYPKHRCNPAAQVT